MMVMSVKTGGVVNNLLANERRAVKRPWRRRSVERLGDVNDIVLSVDEGISMFSHCGLSEIWLGAAAGDDLKFTPW